MQDDVNKLFVGPQFDTCVKTSKLLALLFFAMTYSSGIPLMMPLAFAAFAFYYFLNKFLFLRYYKRPPKISDAITRRAVRLLPLAAIIRLGFACWMLGNGDILPPNFPGGNLDAGSEAIDSGASFSTDQYVNNLNQYYSSYGKDNGLAWIGDRVAQPNTFPLLICIAFIIVVKFLFFIWPYLPLSWALRLLDYLYKCMCKRSAQVFVDEYGRKMTEIKPYDIHRMRDPLRREVCPFTDDYFSYMADKLEKKSQFGSCAPRKVDTLDRQHEVDGWVRIDQDRYVIKSKRWNYSTQFNGIPRKAGDLKKTFEVISDVGCYSYELDKVPDYTLAVQGLKAGALRRKNQQNGSDLA